MANPPTQNPAAAVLSFKTANASAIARVLERAERNGAKAARKKTSAIRHMLHPRSTLLGSALTMALNHHGQTARGKASIRQVAPDTGGRPYHFGFTSVTKGQSARGGRPAPQAGGASAAPGSGSGGSGHGGTGPGNGSAHHPSTSGSGQAGSSQQPAAGSREGAHQKYTERDSALDKDARPIEQELQGARGQERGKGRSLDEEGVVGEQSLEAGPQPHAVVLRQAEAGLGRESEGQEPGQHGQTRDTAETQRWLEEQVAAAPGLSARSTEGAAQAYIENPGKVERLRGTTASFGTIADTLEERLEFWDLVHKHESKDGRTQSRLVLELPHEATAQARHEIVRRYTDELREKGIPFWASIHAPTRKNDYRNHHAHVVFIDRPAQKMAHPETGDLVWDFTVEQVHRTKTSGNIRRTYPYRQKRDLDMRRRGYIKEARARFSDITNDVMERHGLEIRYDPRSYKDMGLDVTPMAHVTRILADKTRSQQFVVMDPGWTCRMVDEEMRAAAARRDDTYQALRATEERLQQTAGHIRKVTASNAKLPRHMRLSPGHVLTTRIAGALTTKMMEIERERLTEVFFDEAMVRTLTRIAEATTPRVHSRGPARVYNPASAPDPQDLADLNHAALEELAAFRIGQRLRGQHFRLRRNQALDRWQQAAAPATSSASPPPSDSRREPPSRSQTLAPPADRPGGSAPPSRPTPPPPPAPDRGPRPRIPSFGRTQQTAPPTIQTSFGRVYDGRAAAAVQPSRFAAQITARMTTMTSAILRDADGPMDVARASSDFVAMTSAMMTAVRSGLFAGVQRPTDSAAERPPPSRDHASPAAAAPEQRPQEYASPGPTGQTRAPSTPRQQPARKAEPAQTTGSLRRTYKHGPAPMASARSTAQPLGKEAPTPAMTGKLDPRSVDRALHQATFPDRQDSRGPAPGHVVRVTPAITGSGRTEIPDQSPRPGVECILPQGSAAGTQSPGVDKKPLAAPPSLPVAVTQPGFLQRAELRTEPSKKVRSPGHSAEKEDKEKRKETDDNETKIIDKGFVAAEELKRRKRRRAILTRKIRDNQGMDI